MTRMKRLAPYLLVGPISGPLLAGVVVNYRKGERLLAGLYLIALVQYAVLLPAVGVKLGLHLA